MLGQVRRLLILSSAATALTTVAPWGSSGQRARSSYEIVDVAGRSGVLPDGLATAAPLWYLIPALCGAAVLAAALERTRMAAVAAGTLGTLTAVGGALVVRSPLVAEPAAVAGLVGGLVTATCAVVVVVASGRRWER